MCELFAINSNVSVHANTYLNEFFQGSVENPDGWGMTWRAGMLSDPLMFREPIRAIDSKLLQQTLSKSIKVDRMIAHTRKATEGEPKVVNCHPFVGEDITGRVWTMAHNGILFNEELLAGYAKREEGDTDSERTLLFLLDVLDEAALRNGGSLSFEERFNTLANALAQLTNLNRLNLILDDGDYTYVHTNTSLETLHMLELQSDSGRSIIFSTRSLTHIAPAESWKAVPRNRLIAYRHGKLVKCSAPHGYTFCEVILDLRKQFGERWPEAVA